MIALSIRQPWAWLIINAGKDIENRTWATRYRGRFLVHAGKGMTHDEYDDAMEFATFACKVPSDKLPRFEDLPRGGVVGSVELADCVTRTDSRWFLGNYREKNTHGFVLRNPAPMEFIPFKGQLGFFDVPQLILPPDFSLRT